MTITPQQLRYVRQSYGLSQEKLAEILDVHTNTISMVENGRRGMSENLAERFTNTLDLTVERVQEIEAAYTEIERLKAAASSV